MELEQLWGGGDWAGLPEGPTGPPRAEGTAGLSVCSGTHSRLWQP